MRERRRRALWTALVVMALLASGCGARLSSDDVAALQARNSSGGLSAGQTGSNRPGSAGESATGNAGGSSTTTPGATSGGGGGGGGGGAGGGGDGAAASCSPVGASDVGVTESEITLGEVSTISGPVPGLGQTAVNGTRAYLEYINATRGGVCGRQLRLLVGDDRLDAGANRSEHQRLMPSVLAFVGGWSVEDAGGASVLNGTNIPDVGLAISDQRNGLANNFSTSPIPLDGSSGTREILEYMRDTYGLTRAAVVWGNQAVARQRAEGYVRDLQSMGLTVLQREVAITQTDYTAVAQDIANDQSDFLITALEITGISRLAKSLQQVGYVPEVPFYGAQVYGTAFLQLAGDAANGAIVGLGHSILEDDTPEMDTFREWYQRVNPGQVIDFFSFQGWAAGAMLVQALEEAGPSPTRDSVMARLQTYTTFDADGIIAPVNPAQKVGAKCFMVATVEDNQWRRVFPAEAYHCV